MTAITIEIPQEGGESKLRMITTKDVLKFMGISNSLANALYKSSIDDDLAILIGYNYLVRYCSTAFDIESPPSLHRAIIDGVEAKQEGSPCPDYDERESWLVGQGVSKQLAQTIAEICSWSDCKQFPDRARQTIEESIRNGESNEMRPEWAPNLFDK